MGFECFATKLIGEYARVQPSPKAPSNRDIVENEDENEMFPGVHYQIQNVFFEAMNGAYEALTHTVCIAYYDVWF